MRYSEVAFVLKNAEEWQKDLFIQELGSFGFDTFEDTESGFNAYIATEQLDLDQLDLLILGQPIGLSVQYSSREIEHQNWNQLWESNFQPLDILGKCYVRATFHPAKPEYEYEIVIDPKMAFGTGHHQTTSMMMKFLLEMDLEGKSLLDMGCGTGILAILAAKRGASPIFAVDYDDVCYDSTRENVLLNEISDVEIACGSVELIVGRKFDIIVANINRNILLDHLPQYAESCEKGGLLLLSGFFIEDDLSFLTEQAQVVGFELDAVFEDGKWAAARFFRI